VGFLIELKKLKSTAGTVSCSLRFMKPGILDLVSSFIGDFWSDDLGLFWHTGIVVIDRKNRNYLQETGM
jgi:hypothetical protein